MTAGELGAQPAFPFTTNIATDNWYPGVSKLELFTALAMAGLLANPNGSGSLRGGLERAALDEALIQIDALAKDATP